MLLGSLIAGLRGQAALQAENIALRHQLTVLQHTSDQSSNQATDVCGFGCRGCGRYGVLPYSSSCLKPSSAGIVKDFVGIGLGSFGTERPDGLKFRNKSAI